MAKPGIDVLLAMEGPKKPSVDDSASDGMPEPDEDDTGLPPAFELAWKQYHDHPSAQSFWDAVESCKNDKPEASPAPYKG